MRNSFSSKAAFIQRLIEAFENDHIDLPRIDWDCPKGSEVPEFLAKACPPNHLAYEEARKLFNSKFQLFPLAIIFCSCIDHIRIAIREASDAGIALRVRSGGHDHEGESSETDALLIDLSMLNRVEVDNSNGIARIEPGISFEKLTATLARHGVMIPHGTCATVCIGGFSMGGGWGPWTRKHGMCCEHIIGATIILANGDVKQARMNGEEAEQQLLWAIKGGGGFSYGIVTDLLIKTFELPEEMYRFSVTWNPNPKYPGDPTKSEFSDNEKRELPSPALTPTLGILDAWEKAIRDTSSVEANQLVGTNLKIYARPPIETGSFNPETIGHGCVMYGYWEGKRSSLEAFIKKLAAASGAQPGSYTTTIGRPVGKDFDYESGSLMNDWDRTSSHEFTTLHRGQRTAYQTENGDNSPELESAEPFNPDVEGRQAHKITSRLVNANGLGREGQFKLIKSLTSPLIHEENLESKLYTYVTLGAITGNYYQNEIREEEKRQSAFPYKDSLYTIQYQTWWGIEDGDSGETINDHTNRHLNRALDWMTECRDYSIPNTSGAFISFKDSSIATRTYFDKSYERLVEIKETHSQDPDNLFQTRKTIT
ncbi:MAG: FAD-binding protein [bacterium]